MNNSKILLTLIITSLLFLTACDSEFPTLPDDPPAPGEDVDTNLVGQATGVADERFSAPEFELTPEVVEKPGAIEVRNDDTIVWSSGYVSIDGSTWSEFSLEGERVSQSNWLRAGASADIPIGADAPEGNNNYVILYSCQLFANSWDCRENKWQIATFTIESTCEEGEIIDNQICTNGELIPLPEAPEPPQQPQQALTCASLIETTQGSCKHYCFDENEEYLYCANKGYCLHPDRPKNIFCSSECPNCTPEVLQLGEINNISVYHQGSNDSVRILLVPTLLSDPTEILDIAESTIHTGEHAFFTKEPFSSRTEDFTFLVSQENIDPELFDCDDAPAKGWYKVYVCNHRYFEHLYDTLDVDYITVIFNKTARLSSGGIVPTLDHQRRRGFTLTHELAHTIYGFADSYITTGSPAYRCGEYTGQQAESCFERQADVAEYLPNIDTVGCPSWCEDYNLTLLEQENEECTQFSEQETCEEYRSGGVCTWFNHPHPVLDAQCVKTQGFVDIGLNCQQGMTCEYGADYGQLAYAPQSTIMKGGSTFSEVEKDFINQAMDCCYPRNDSSSCEEFREKYAEPPSDTNWYLKQAMQKLMSCNE